MSREELADYDFSRFHPVDAVVVGHDTAFNFRKLCIANVLLQWNADARLVATNMDAFDLVGADGRRIPGNGSLVASVRLWIVFILIVIVEEFRVWSSHRFFSFLRIFPTTMMDGRSNTLPGGKPSMWGNRARRSST